MGTRARLEHGKAGLPSEGRNSFPEAGIASCGRISIPVRLELSIPIPTLPKEHAGNPGHVDLMGRVVAASEWRGVALYQLHDLLRGSWLVVGTSPSPAIGSLTRVNGILTRFIVGGGLIAEGVAVVENSQRSTP